MLEHQIEFLFFKNYSVLTAVITSPEFFARASERRNVAVAVSRAVIRATFCRDSIRSRDAI